MKRFQEFVDERDGVIHTDSAELLHRIVKNHGERFKLLLKDMLPTIDDDPDLVKDLKQLFHSITPDQYPVSSQKNNQTDVVSRPEADTAAGEIE